MSKSLTPDTDSIVASPVSKRKTWLIAVSITLGVVLFFVLVYGAAAYLLFTGLKKTGDYLNGAPITVTDKAVQARIESDSEWLRIGDYGQFDRKVGLTDSQGRYREDMNALQKAGDCTLKPDKITKGQGGFDGGASINYDGTVTCAGNEAYKVVAQYHGSALSKKEAADMSEFTLTELVVMTEDQALLESYIRRTSSPIDLNVIPNETTGSGARNPLTPRQYATFEEYKTAITYGEIAGCEPDRKANLQIRFRWQSRSVPGEVREYTSFPTYRCK